SIAAGVSAALAGTAAAITIAAAARKAVRRARKTSLRPLLDGAGNAGKATGDLLLLPFASTGLADGFGLGKSALPRHFADSPQLLGSPVRISPIRRGTGACPSWTVRHPVGRFLTLWSQGW